MKSNLFPTFLIALLPASYAWQVYGWGAGLSVYLLVYLGLVLLGWAYALKGWPIRRLQMARFALVAIAMAVIGLSAMEHCDRDLCHRVFWSK